MARVEAGEEDPSCRGCGGILKTATVSFGQQLPPDVVADAFRWSVEADVFLVVGSSLVVYPAADMPAQAKYAGAGLVIVNREPTPLDHLADVVVRADAGPTLRAVVQRVESVKPRS
jgi:NAD-dependent deacetylase